MIEAQILVVCVALLLIFGLAVPISIVRRSSAEAQRARAARDDALAETSQAECKVEEFRLRAEGMLVRLNDATVKHEADRAEMTATIERQTAALTDALAKLSHAEEAEKRRGRELATMTEDRDWAAQACMNHIARIGALEREVDTAQPDVARVKAWAREAA